MQPILYTKLSARGIDIACLDEGEITPLGKGVRQFSIVRQGVDKELARKIVRIVKDSKTKVQAAIQGEQIRVTGKKRDEVQQIIAMWGTRDFPSINDKKPCNPRHP